MVPDFNQDRVASTLPNRQEVESITLEHQTTGYALAEAVATRTSLKSTGLVVCRSRLVVQWDRMKRCFGFLR